jgi:hypothetical protein
MNRGELIIARASNGHPRRMIFWDVYPKGLMLCSEANYQTLTHGERGLAPVGVPIEDCYVYDEAIWNELVANWQNDLSAWGKATPCTK